MKHLLPEDCYYAETHEWAQVDENIVTLGRTEFSEDKLGEIIYIDLPEQGTKVNKGESFGSIESVKEMSDLISPVSGTVIEINESLFEDPGLLNDDPMNTGWILKIEMDSEKELATLARAAEYRKFVLGKAKFEAKPAAYEEKVED